MCRTNYTDILAVLISMHHLTIFFLKSEEERKSKIKQTLSFVFTFSCFFFSFCLSNSNRKEKHAGYQLIGIACLLQYFDSNNVQMFKYLSDFQRYELQQHIPDVLIILCCYEQHKGYF